MMARPDRAGRAGVGNEGGPAVDAYDRFAAAAAPIGIDIVIVGVVLMLSAIGFLAVYAFRYGTPDEDEGRTVTDRTSAMMPVFVDGLSSVRKASRRKVVYGREGEITDDSLVDGTATPGQRMVVVCIITMFVSLFLLFLGVSLWWMKDNPIVVFFPFVMAAWLGNFLRIVWRDRQKARRRVARRARQRHAE